MSQTATPTPAATSAMPAGSRRDSFIGAVPLAVAGKPIRLSVAKSSICLYRIFMIPHEIYFSAQGNRSRVGEPSAVIHPIGACC
jgi:hypothetical protein